MSIEVTSISKLYGNQLALDNLTFSIPKGSIVGFLGPNGAGKSTLMKILTGYIKPTSGAVFVNGIDVINNPIKAKRKIGYLPEHNPLYKEMYVKEYLQFQANVYKCDLSSINKVIEKVGLPNESHKKIKQLSKGYQQRVGLAAALIHNPEVLILDEPTTGLDPNQLVSIRNLIKEIGKDKTVLFSTHIMQEVTAVCDSVLMIHKGKLVLNTSLDELTTNHTQVVEVTFDYKIEEQFIKKIVNLESYKNSYENTWLLHFNTKDDMRPFVFDFAKVQGLKILEMNTKNKDLENIFKSYTS